MSEPTHKRPITVTVSSKEPGAGKTTLIALIGHALHNTGHNVKVPPQSAGPLNSRSLEQLFDVTFVEAEGPVFTGRQVEAEIVRRTEEMRKSYQHQYEALTREAHELRQHADKSQQEAQQARNALAEAAIIITGLHQDLRTKKA